MQTVCTYTSSLTHTDRQTLTHTHTHSCTSKVFHLLFCVVELFPPLNLGVCFGCKCKWHAWLRCHEKAPRTARWKPNVSWRTLYSSLLSEKKEKTVHNKNISSVFSAKRFQTPWGVQSKATVSLKSHKLEEKNSQCGDWLCLCSRSDSLKFHTFFFFFKGKHKYTQKYTLIPTQSMKESKKKTCLCISACVYIYCIYSGENKYLNPCRFRKFDHLQRNVWSIIVIVGVF